MLESSLATIQLKSEQADPNLSFKNGYVVDIREYSQQHASRYVDLWTTSSGLVHACGSENNATYLDEF